MLTCSCILSTQLKKKILLLLTVIGESKCFKYSIMLCSICYQSKSIKWSRELFQTDVLVLNCMLCVLCTLEFLYGAYVAHKSLPYVIILRAKSLYMISERSVASCRNNVVVEYHLISGKRGLFKRREPRGTYVFGYKPF